MAPENRCGCDYSNAGRWGQGKAVRKMVERKFDRILNNTIILFSSRFFQKALSFLLLVLLTRNLTTSDFGLYSFITVWIATVAAFTDMGTAGGGLRLWAAAPARMAGAFGKLYLIRLLLSLPAVAGSLFVWFSLYSSLPSWGILLISGGILLQIVNVSLVPFQAELLNRYPALWAATNRTFLLLLIALALALKAPLFWIVALEIFFPIFYVARLWHGAQKIVKRTRATSPSAPYSFRELARDIVPVGLLTLLIMAYFRIDVFMLMKMMGKKAVAEYAGGFRLVEPFLTIPGVLALSVFPVVVGRWTGNDRERAEETLRRQARLGTLAMFLIGFLLSRHGGALAIRFFGERYRSSTSVIEILAWTLPVSAWSYPWFGFVQADRKYSAAILLALGALGINILGNLHAIPRWGTAGAAGFTLLTESIWAIGLWRISASKISGTGPLLLKLLSLSLVVLLFSFSLELFLPANRVFRVLSTFAGLSLFSLLTFKLSLLDTEDKNGMAQYLRNLYSRVLSLYNSWRD